MQPRTRVVPSTPQTAVRPRESIRCERENTLTIAGGTQYAQEQYATQSISVANARRVLCTQCATESVRGECCKIILLVAVIL
jgi:hypothetical protein